jgi:hypothetical protein
MVEIGAEQSVFKETAEVLVAASATLVETTTEVVSADETTESEPSAEEPVLRAPRFAI